MRFLLDTNIVSDLMRHPRGPVAKKVEAVGVDSVLTSIIVATELRYGIRRRESERLSRRLDEALGALTVMPFEAPADQIYAEIRTELERKGRPIGNNDVLIAAHARALKVCLVTDNTREFSRVPELMVENWLRM